MSDGHRESETAKLHHLNKNLFSGGKTAETQTFKNLNWFWSLENDLDDDENRFILLYFYVLNSMLNFHNQLPLIKSDHHCNGLLCYFQTAKI